MLRVEVHNGSERAITNVYVWADARGVRGHYAAGVPVEDAQARRMANVPRDGDLFWQLRVVRPGQHAFFTQLTHLSPQPVVARADADITAFAEFTDTDGVWWRCDEDGRVTRRQPREPPPGAAGGRRAERGRGRGVHRGISPVSAGRQKARPRRAGDSGGASSAGPPPPPRRDEDPAPRP